MFRQEERAVREFSEQQENDMIAMKAEAISQAENAIDIDDKLYLLTWSPDPKKLPDCDFLNQHIWCVPYVWDYLNYCKAGCACVESTQLGNPHYHMWYQTYDDNRELGRVAIIKVLSKIGNIKIESSVRYYKIDKWYSTKNALYYYKEDCINQQLFTPYNPITKDMCLPEINYNDYNMFFHQGKQTVRQCIERASQVHTLREFYKKSF